MVLFLQKLPNSHFIRFIGREFRVLFLSTFEATHNDGSTRNPTKSIMDPYVVNTAVSRARSLVVSVGNPYLLLSMEKHMCKKYGEKAKYWSNYIKKCIEHDSFVFDHNIDVDKRRQIDLLQQLVTKQIETKYEVEEGKPSLYCCTFVVTIIFTTDTGTGSGSTPVRIEEKDSVSYN